MACLGDEVHRVHHDKLEETGLERWDEDKLRRALCAELELQLYPVHRK